MRRKFYLNKRDGKLMGVCAGLADYTGIEALWIRVAAVALVLAGVGLLPVAYLIAGLAADKRPDALDHFGVGSGLSAVHHREREGMFGDVEHYYSASNPRLSREIDGLR
jgi:phage shock protein C